MTHLRKSFANVDLAAVRHNYLQACRLAPDSRAIAVIKANAYGHGAVAVARALKEIVPAFAVAFLDEALELRAAGINNPLLILEGVSEPEALRIAADQQLTVVVHHESQLPLFTRAKLSRRVKVWLMIDTGMHRLGIEPARFEHVLATLRESGGCEDDIVACTHLAEADDCASDATMRQIDTFDTCVAGHDLKMSISNSAGVLAWPTSHRHWNRPGYMLFGNSPMAEEHPDAADLRPAMALTSEVIAVRELLAGDATGYGGRWRATGPARIATVALGYADGYPRTAADGTPVLINGREAPLAGVVSMDMITVDVSHLPGVRPGDPVLLWGPGLAVDRVAALAGTSGYELLARVSQRVPRVYSE